MASTLSLHIDDTNNLKTLRIVDESDYNKDIDVSNGIIEITIPGYQYAMNYNVKPYFNVVFNASLLGIKKVKSKDQLVDLPDGVYKIKYSIKPNDKLFVEYDYFRVSRLYDKFKRVLCCYLNKKVDMTISDFNSKKKELLWIRNLIDAAKYQVEDLHEIKKGFELYNEANSLLGEYLNCDCV